MRRILLFLMLMIAIPSMAQSTTVSTTGIVDTDGFTWSNATYQITFVPSPNWPSIGSYTWTGGALTGVFSGSASGTGTFSLSLPSNTAISPSGSAWKFTICPNASSGCFSATASITGATQDITSLLNSYATGPRFSVTPTGFGYTPTEVSPTPLPGSWFFNTTTQSCQQWNGSTWQSCYTGVTGGTIAASTIGCSPTYVGTTTNLGGCAGVSTLVTSPQTMAGALSAPALNNVVSACGYAGATADVQINAAFAALPSSKGTVDATCYGTTTQQFASPVTLQTGQYLKLSHATSITPPSASSNVVNVSLGSSLEGLHVSLSSYPTTYTGSAVNYTCPASGTPGSVGPTITNILVDGATSGTGSALTLNSNSSFCGIYATVVRGLASVGLNNPLVLETSSTGAWINGNEFHDLMLTGSSTAGQPATCISLLNNSLEILGNIFDGYCEGEGIANATGVSASQPSGTYFIAGNTFAMNIYDVTNSWYIPAASTAGRVAVNSIMGYADGATNDTSQLNTIGILKPAGGTQSIFIGSMAGVGAPWFNAMNANQILNWQGKQILGIGGINLSIIPPVSGGSIYAADPVSGQAPFDGLKYRINSIDVVPATASGNTGFPGNVVGSASPAGTGTWTAYHYKATGTPGIACGTGAGTSPTVCTIAGNDEDGVVNVTTGTAPASNAIIFTATLANPCPVGIAPVVRGANAASAQLTGNTHDFPSGVTTSTWTLTSNATGLGATTAYKWNYHAGCY